MLAIDTSAENISITTCHAAADPILTRSAASASDASLFVHAAAEILVREPKTVRCHMFDGGRQACR